MGFKSQAVIQEILALAGENSDSNETNKRIMYLCGGESGHSLPDGTKFEVLLLDVPSWQFRLFTSASTGQDILDKIQTQVNEDFRFLGVQKFIFCFDDRALVTAAKIRERKIREYKLQKQNILPYTDTIRLKNGTVVKAASYEFRLDSSMPEDFARVVATPPLLKRALIFLCELIEKHICHPAPGECDVTMQIVGRMAVSATETFVTKRFFFADQDSFTEKSSEKCLVGEAESQCMYYAKRLYDLGQATNFLIRANDSDTVALGLLHLPTFLRPGANKIGVKLWFDTTSSASERRLIDAVRLWRKLKKGLAMIPSRVVAGDNKKKRARSEEAATAVEYTLRNDVETVLAVAMLTGNDYCVGFPRVGPGIMFKCIKDGLISPLKATGQSLVQRDLKTGEMLINEPALMAFVVYCYCSMGKVQTLLKERPVAKLAKAVSQNEHWPTSSADQKLFFEELSSQVWMHGKSVVKVPNYNLARAHVRRAFFSLYYYTNVTQWSERAVREFSVDPMTHLSIFGHKEIVFEPLEEAGGAENEEDGDAGVMIGLAAKVWTHNKNGERVQPFMHRTQVENQKVDNEIPINQHFANRDRRRRTDLTEEYTEAEGTPNSLWTNTAALAWVDPAARNSSGEYGSHMRASSSSAILKQD